MHVKAPLPHHLPYLIQDEAGRRIEHVIEADDETGEYVITYFRSGKILTGQSGHILCTHKRAAHLTIVPLPDHPHHVSEDDLPLLRLFTQVVPAIQAAAGDFESVTLTRDQLADKMMFVLDLVLNACAGNSPAGPGFVWVPVVERNDDGEPLPIPTAEGRYSDAADVWSKYNRLCVNYPDYLETETPPLGFHPENA